MPNKPVLPLLKDAGWSNHEFTLCRKLTDLPAPRVPWLAFGYDHPHTFEFVVRETVLKERQDTPGNVLAETERQALDHLRAYPAVWEQHTFGEMTLLVASSSFYAAEHVLLADFMQQAHDLLKAEYLMVGIPTRGMMFACSALDQKEIVGRFSAVVSARYHRGETAQITPTVFVMEKGVLKGFLSVSEDLGKQMVEDERKSEVSDVFLRAFFATAPADKAGGRETLLICAGGVDLDKLEFAVHNAFVQSLAQCLENEAFGGEIRVVILDQMTPDTPELRAAMTSIQNKLAGIAADTSQIAQKASPIRVRVQYGLSMES
jgi:hypothetical protein